MSTGYEYLNLQLFVSNPGIFAYYEGSFTAAVSVKIYVEMSLDKSAFNTDNGSKREQALCSLTLGYAPAAAIRI
jgi:hypothetical protein